MIEAAKLEADIYPAGPRGLSAYEIYKKEGGQLSEEEWLKSLNGLTPTIGENGNWFLGTVDTGLPSRGPKGDTGSIKFIVVTELPTENIDETAIYLKPVEKPTGENKFEELIYVNGKWEDLGTPNVEVDLSNYYTKTESDEKLLAKQDKLLAGENITIEGNVISASGGDNNDVSIYTWIYNNFPNSTGSNIKDAYGTFFQDIINDAYTKGKKGIIVIKTSENGSGLNLDYQYALTATNCNLQLQPTVIAFIGDPAGMDTNIYQRMNFQWARVRAGGTWDNGVFTLDFLYWDGIKNVSFLPTNNMWNYTPTADYNPATKKYVDDNIKTYTAADNITISEDNVISASGGSNYPIYQMIARWDNLSISGSSSSTITTDETIVNILNNFLTNVANQDNQIGTLTLMNVPSRFDSFSANYIGISNIIQFNQTLTRFTLCLNIYCFGAEGRYEYRRIGAFHKFSGNGKWENNSFSITSLSLSKDSGDSTGRMYFTSATEEKVDREYLKKTNTTSFTPTGDYNPATKKYVDDQVGNINTVLATLTTVSEVTK